MKLNTVENRKKVHEIEQIEIEGEVLPGWAVDEATKLNRKQNYLKQEMELF